MVVSGEIITIVNDMIQKHHTHLRFLMMPSMVTPLKTNLRKLHTHPHTTQWMSLHGSEQNCTAIGSEKNAANCLKNIANISFSSGGPATTTSKRRRNQPINKPHKHRAPTPVRLTPTRGCWTVSIQIQNSHK